MAPEVLLGTHDLDARSDLYALGVLAFECLTGRCPFPGDLEAVIDQHVAGLSPTFTEYRPDLDGAFDIWMARALHPDPSFRFASARELRDCLDRAMRSGNTPSRLPMRFSDERQAA
jgi:eukaryotic-like serine/threonine-protein kinase